jgi:hypothetical protein
MFFGYAVLLKRFLSFFLMFFCLDALEYNSGTFGLKLPPILFLDVPWVPRFVGVFFEDALGFIREYTNGGSYFGTWHRFVEVFLAFLMFFIFFLYFIFFGFLFFYCIHTFYLRDLTSPDIQRGTFGPWSVFF